MWEVLGHGPEVGKCGLRVRVWGEEFGVKVEELRVNG